jgi:DNA-3-methyladenine glycosylase II
MMATRVDAAAVRVRPPFARGFDLGVARRALGRRDAALAAWMRKIGTLDSARKGWGEPFEPVDALARAIMYQQLSGKAAATIVGRVERLLPNGPHIHAGDLMQARAEDLRGCGVSGNKQRALKDLAEKALAGIVPTVQRLRYLHDHQIIERLTEVRGIGQWTVEMMLIFRLGRPDVLPVDDLGIRKGAQIVLGLAEVPKPKELIQIGAHWAPYRTLASLYLWRVQDQPKGEPVKRSQG